MNELFYYDMFLKWFISQSSSPSDMRLCVILGEIHDLRYIVLCHTSLLPLLVRRDQGLESHFNDLENVLAAALFTAPF